MEKINGFIKLHRSFLDWEWYSDPNVAKLFIHCLLKANFKDTKYKGYHVERGCFLTGFEALSRETRLTVQQLRTAIRKLKSTNEITTFTSSQGTKIQVVNYDKYQQLTSESTNDQQTTNKQPTNDQQLNKKDKKEKKEKNNIIKGFEWGDIENYFYKQAEEYKLDSEKLLKKVAWAFEYYKELDWKNSKGKEIKNLKSTIKNNWIKDYEEYKLVKPYQKPKVSL
jgi:hypothetical protein